MTIEQRMQEFLEQYGDVKMEFSSFQGYSIYYTFADTPGNLASYPNTKISAYCDISGGGLEGSRFETVKSLKREGFYFVLNDLPINDPDYLGEE